MSEDPVNIVEVDTDLLDLDLKNPRLWTEPRTESDAIRIMFEHEDAIKLARSILTNSYLSSEMPIVIEKNGRYIVLEGNRRLAVIKALGSTELAGKFKEDLDRLVVKYEKEVSAIPNKLHVYLVASREEAQPHLARLHVGRSKKSWDRAQQAKYCLEALEGGREYKELKDEFKSLNRLLRMAYMSRFLSNIKFEDATLKEFVRSKKFNMSAFEYAYGDPSIADAMGIQFDGYCLSPRSKRASEIARDLTKSERRAVEFIVSEMRSKSLNTRSNEFKKGTDEYRDLLLRMGPSGKSIAGCDRVLPGTSIEHTRMGIQRTAEPKMELSGTHLNDGSEDVDAHKQSVRRGPNNPDTLKGFDVSHLLTGANKDKLPIGLKRLYLELRYIDVKQTPSAASILLRSVLEGTVKWHYEELGGDTKGALSKSFKNVYNDYGGNGLYRAVIDRCNSGKVSEPGSIKWFNTAVHSAYNPVSHTDAREAFDLVEPILRFLISNSQSQSS